MTTEANPAGAQAAPIAPAQPANAAPAVQPPAAAAKPKYEVDYDPNNPPWLGDRIEQAKRSAAKEAEVNARKAMLSELGIDDPEVVKKLVSEKKKRDEDAKSQEQKLAELQLREQQNQARLKELEEVVKLDAAEQLAALTAEQREAVLAVAGDDPAKQRSVIAKFRPTWTKSAPDTSQSQGQSNANGSQVTAGQTQPAVPPPKPAAATAPGATAPPPAGTQVVSNHLQVYEQLLAASPFVAADYYQAHYAAINEARGARS